MVARIKTFAFNGIKMLEVNAEVKISPGLATFNIVGLPDKAVAESRERVRAALTSMGLALPAQRIIVNLAPADLLKEGSHYDLPIALGILVEMQILKQSELDDYYVLGELSLDGNLNSIAGSLPAAIEANAHGCGIICPSKSAGEALWAGDNLRILAPDNLLQLVNHLTNRQTLAMPTLSSQSTDDPIVTPDMSDVVGQDRAKRAMEIAAAGGHNIMMIGSPGSGKSMLAARFTSILPKLSLREILEINMIASVAGLLKDGKLITQRPYRDPHHSCSMIAMVGGGAKAKPGEVSLAHRGVLFLDEVAEFPRAVLDALRQPLETGEITISRAQSHVTFPADFQLIAAMNPCRCGYAFNLSKRCNRAPACAKEYQSKISGPMMDRIDLYVEMTEVNLLRLTEEQLKVPRETSAQIAVRVQQARDIQYERYQVEGITNANVSSSQLQPYVELDTESKQILEQVMERSSMSMRGYNRLLRMTRTVADLSGNEKIHINNLLEALSYHKGFNSAELNQKR